MECSKEYDNWIRRCLELSKDNKQFWSEIIQKHENIFFEGEEDDQC